MLSSNENEELNILKTELKEKIKERINENKLLEAKSIIAQYESIINFDSEIYSMKGIIEFIEGNLERAEQLFKEGLLLDSKNFDLLYNMGYLYEQNSRYREAYHFYSQAKQHCENQTMLQQIECILETIKADQSVQYHDLNRSNIKKVLVIAHIFPPIGGSGVQRTLKFVKYLKLYGWEPIVVTAGHTRYPLIDKSLLPEVPSDITIIRVDEPDIQNLKDISIQDILNLQKNVIDHNELMKEFITETQNNRYLLYTPDQYSPWSVQVIKIISQKINFSNIDLIYSTSGPYSNHVIGYMLKQLSGKQWVADFRDEWTNNSYAKFDTQSILYKMNYRMEEQIVNFADKIITTTPLASKNYIDLFHLEKDKVLTITNGYDEEDFKDISTSNAKNEKFTFFHNGLLYSIRTPKTFLLALKNLIEKGLIDRETIKVGFTWTENDDLWIDLVEMLELQDIVEFYGYLSHHDSLVKASKADALLLIVGSGEKNKSVYPGKIFEYLRLNKPIISLAPKGSLVEDLIMQTGRGTNDEFDDIRSIEKSILLVYEKWKKDSILHYTNDKEIEKFERRNLTKKLARVFEKMFEQ